MTNDLQQARVEAAAKVLLRDYQSEYDGGEVSEFLDVARAALAAADAHLPSVEMIAEALRKHRRNKAINYGAEYACICGEVLRSNSHYAQSEHQAEAVRALFGEVA